MIRNPGKSPNAMRVYAYGPAAPGRPRLKPAKMQARMTAPLAVNSHALVLLAKPYGDSAAGRRKTPEPMTLPTTSAVHIQNPSRREVSLTGVFIGAPLR